jgi:di/tricarboxylate transporter
VAASYSVFLVLFVTLVLFIWGYWRYDIVALMALMSLVILKAIPYSLAFSGFSNPAVITVACVMVLTHTITRSGILDSMVNHLSRLTKTPILHVGILCLIAAVLSAFMNNVGALALMMPVAIKTALQYKRSPAMVLMPLSFASVLGGLCTSIGTPPNLLISAYRGQVTGQVFQMFDFAPVGLVVASIAILFIALLGWRLLPYDRKVPSQSLDNFQIQDYISEVRITSTSTYIDKPLQELERSIQGDFAILGLIRGKVKRLAISPSEILQDGDILIVEASHEDLEKVVDGGKFVIASNDAISSELLRSKNITLVEAVVPPGSRVEGRSWQRTRIRSRYRINLLAIARQGRAFQKRLNHVNLRAGDVVLCQGDSETIYDSLLTLGFVPLFERHVQVGLPKFVLLPLLIFALSIVVAALGIFPIQIAFSLAVGCLVLLNIIPARTLYKNIDWSIITLLGAMIPVGNALQATGGTELIANLFLSLTGNFPAYVIFGLLLLITMTLSDIMNNAATAVVMAPIAVSIANAMHVNVDPFLMTVAVGASCSFLTPISHQNNTLVMGPGGYKFYDFLRLGLPIEGIVLLIGLPMILWIWPI